LPRGGRKKEREKKKKKEEKKNRGQGVVIRGPRRGAARCRMFLGTDNADAAAVLGVQLWVRVNRVVSRSQVSQRFRGASTCERCRFFSVGGTRDAITRASSDLMGVCVALSLPLHLSVFISLFSISSFSTSLPLYHPSLYSLSSISPSIRLYLFLYLSPFSSFSLHISIYTYPFFSFLFFLSLFSLATFLPCHIPQV
jgi:hypothetical protein